MKKSFPGSNAAGDRQPALLEGALGHLLRYTLDGCGHSRQVAVRLLDHLADQPGIEGEMRGLCSRMSEALERGPNPCKTRHG
ncbi:MAG: hypothetical protein WBP72_11110 [Rhodocyclaceae bacterium]